LPPQLASPAAVFDFATRIGGVGDCTLRRYSGPLLVLQPSQEILGPSQWQPRRWTKGSGEFTICIKGIMGPAAPLRFGGAVAQLGEHLVRNEEVRGSIPLGCTS